MAVPACQTPMPALKKLFYPSFVVLATSVIKARLAFPLGSGTSQQLNDAALHNWLRNPALQLQPLPHNSAAESAETSTQENLCMNKVPKDSPKIHSASSITSSA